MEKRERKIERGKMKSMRKNRERDEIEGDGESRRRGGMREKEREREEGEGLCSQRSREARTFDLLGWKY